jgi:hypothetical protein
VKSSNCCRLDHLDEALDIESLREKWEAFITTQLRKSYALSFISWRESTVTCIQSELSWERALACFSAQSLAALWKHLRGSCIGLARSSQSRGRAYIMFSQRELLRSWTKWKTVAVDAFARRHAAVLGAGEWHAKCLGRAVWRLRYEVNRHSSYSLLTTAYRGYI